MEDALRTVARKSVGNRRFTIQCIARRRAHYVLQQRVRPQTTAASAASAGFAAPALDPFDSGGTGFLKLCYPVIRDQKNQLLITDPSRTSV